MVVAVPLSLAMSGDMEKVFATDEFSLVGIAGIPGTTLFDGSQARKGYALNKMCYSFNAAANRQAFLADEEGYMRQYGLTEQIGRAHV